MKILAKYLGGSTSYGLATPESDKDERYIFLHTEISKILGLDRYQHESKQTDSIDSFGWDLRHALNLLKRGNTMVLEILYNNDWLEVTPEFLYLQSFKNQLIDSHKLYKCLIGYCFSERQLVLGKRTGLLGGKRKESLERFGYSPKNLVQYLRLCLAGTVFFQDGYFPVNIRKLDERDLLFNIKTNPQNFNKETAIKLMDDFEIKLNNSYTNIKYIYQYNEKLANQLCYDLYFPILASAKNLEESASGYKYYQVHIGLDKL